MDLTLRRHYHVRAVPCSNKLQYHSQWTSNHIDNYICYVYICTPTHMRSFQLGMGMLSELLQAKGDLPSFLVFPGIAISHHIQTGLKLPSTDQNWYNPMPAEMLHRTLPGSLYHTTPSNRKKKINIYFLCLLLKPVSSDHALKSLRFS